MEERPVETKPRSAIAPLHVDGRWCADLKCAKCYSADTWQRAKVTMLENSLEEAMAEISNLRRDMERGMANHNADLNAVVPSHVAERETERAFYWKHAMGAKVCPSCLVCGHAKDRDEWAITHGELPNIYVCTGCVAGAPSSTRPMTRDQIERMRSVLIESMTDSEGEYPEEVETIVDMALKWIELGERRSAIAPCEKKK